MNGFHRIDGCPVCGAEVKSVELVRTEPTLPVTIREAVARPCGCQMGVNGLVSLYRTRGWLGPVHLGTAQIFKDPNETVCEECGKPFLALRRESESTSSLTYGPCECQKRKLVAGRMTVEEAQGRGVCRICEQEISNDGHPRGWKESFSRMVFPPPAVVLAYGREFAHAECLESELAKL